MEKIDFSRRDVISIAVRAVIFTVGIVLLTLAMDYPNLVNFEGELLRTSLRNDVLIPTVLGLPTFIAALSRIKQLTRAREQLEILAYTDSLTGVLNRRAFQEKLNKHLDKSKTGDCALLIIDIDNFKLVNDTFGHDVGDRIIIAVADELKKATVANEVMGRIGGEEFVVFLPLATERLARLQAEHIRIVIENSPSALSLLGKPITISIGVAAMPLCTSFQTLYKRADDALYEAKSTGRNRVVMAKEKDREHMPQSFSFKA